MIEKNYTRIYGCRGYLKTTKQETKVTEAKPNEINFVQAERQREKEEEGRKEERMSERDRQREEKSIEKVF